VVLIPGTGPGYVVPASQTGEIPPILNHRQPLHRVLPVCAADSMLLPESAGRTGLAAYVAISYFLVEYQSLAALMVSVPPSAFHCVRNLS
jgi:hypothetical protein